ncbi:Gfo/Idh/MocA family protein [Lacisediminihabitans sp.]|uniref:Gfo/Idh/MocA family protein n=1 Tax=Lacisediminihabitans sp. TaxID=2787631 RepID=UPI00374DD066
MAKTLNVAVLGFWHVHAGDYARQAQEDPGTTLVAVWDDDADRGREGAARFGVEFVGDLDELLARPDIDAVTVTTSTNVHRDIMVKAANAGKHIFTEKLLAPTVAEAEEILAAADANDVKVVVSLPRLYDGYTQAIRTVIDGGGLGRITYSRVRLSHGGAVSGWLPERFFDRQTAIGGALTDLGCHPVYLTQLFLGAAPSTVSATYRSVTGRVVDDSAVVTVGYDNQAIGVIEAGFVSENPFTVEIFGTEGSLAYSDWGNTLTVSGAAFGGEGWHSIDVPDAVPGAFAQWVDHIADGTRADENLSRAVELTRLVVAANAAAASGASVSL